MIGLLIEVILVGGVLGFISANLTKWLDGAMSYRGIFEKIRRNRALKYDPSISFSEVDKIRDFDEASNMLDVIYWNLCTYKKGFMVWLCRDCMSTRINLAMTVVTLIILFLLSGFNLTMFLIFIFSFAANKYYL